LPDYKEMYLKMVRATEAAMQTLIRAQQECEEMYIADEEPQRINFPTKFSEGIETEKK